MIRALAVILAVLRMFLILIHLALFVLFGLIAIKVVRDKRSFAFLIRKIWCRIAVFILGIKVIKSGFLEFPSGVLYISNHRSLIDAVIAFSIINDGFVISKAEVADYPLISTGARLSGVVFVKREDRESRIQTKNTIVELLEHNCSVLVYPEGTVSVSKDILEFKKGSFEAAFNADAFVIAMALEYMKPGLDFWHHNNLLLQFIYTFSKWRTVTRIHFFEPLKISNPEKDVIQIKQKIENKLSEFQKNWSLTDRQTYSGKN